MKHLCIIGGGALSLFVAANLKNRKITILEASNDVLKKVKLSGGGRCNLCNYEKDIKKLLEAYPRNANHLKKIFYEFTPEFICNHFYDMGINLKVEDLNRVFPESDDSQEVVDMLLYYATKNNVNILKGAKVEYLTKDGDKFRIETLDDRTFTCDEVLLAIGGNWQNSHNLKASLENLGHSFVEDVPSLFAFDLADENFLTLAGVAQNDVNIRSSLIKKEVEGDILFTHKGVSGPAVLKLSSYGAVDFAKNDYKFSINISFVKAEYAREFFKYARLNAARKLVKNYNIPDMRNALWQAILRHNNIPADLQYTHLNKAQETALVNSLAKLELEVVGKSVNSTEFVRAGGVNVKEIDFMSMQSKICPDLYLGGEAIDIDAITGGYNLMACWGEGLQIVKKLQA